MQKGPHQRHDGDIAVKAWAGLAELFSMSTNVHRMSTPCPPMTTACPPNVHQCPPKCPPMSTACPPRVHQCPTNRTATHTKHHTAGAVEDRALFERARLEKSRYFLELERPLQILERSKRVHLHGICRETKPDEYLNRCRPIFM